MDGLGISNESPNAWLWQDLQLADVSLEIVFITHATASDSSDADTEAEDLSTDATDVSDIDIEYSTDASSNSVTVDHSAAIDTDASVSHTRQATSGCSSTKTFVLHSQVLGSNSSFFRTMLTSHLGSKKRKLDTESGVRRLQMNAQVDAENAHTVEVLLEYFYKHTLSEALSGADLLKLMQVRSVTPDLINQKCFS